MTGVSGWRSLNLRQQLQAALAGQGQVEQHQVKVFQLQNAQPLLAVAGHLHRVPLQREQHLERLADARFVVDDKDAGAGREAGSRRADVERLKGWSTSGMY